MNESTYQYKFTVFTPTYNRAHTLQRVYESLRSQTLQDFEWIIVDDGSTDSTRSLVEKWQAESTFPLQYIQQENKGKHFAFNRGVKEAKGLLFTSLDSDDACVANALERLNYHWDSILSEKKEYYSGITALCIDQFGNKVGHSLPEDVYDASWLEVDYKMGLKGEKWGTFRTDILKEFPFPEMLQRTYFPESIIWFRISGTYLTRFFNEELRIYYIDEPSMVHGNTASKNAKGSQLEHMEVLNEYIGYLRYQPLEFLRSAVHYSRFSFLLKMRIHSQLSKLNNLPAKILWVCAVPFGFLISRLDK
jgi:glycosyltransferase involved in cell wall biosynthesis